MGRGNWGLKAILGIVSVVGNGVGIVGGEDGGRSGREVEAGGKDGGVEDVGSGRGAENGARVCSEGGGEVREIENVRSGCPIGGDGGAGGDVDDEDAYEESGGVSALGTALANILANAVEKALPRLSLNCPNLAEEA